MFDVLLTGGWLVDGSGAPPWRADLGAREWLPTIDDTLDRVTIAYVGSPHWSWAEGRSLRDAARPRRPADGVDDVLVNGEFVLRGAAMTGVRAARALRRGQECT